MSTTLDRPPQHNGFHVALSPAALAQATVTPDFVIKQGGTPITPVNGQYPLAVTHTSGKDWFIFEISATDYLADANPVPAWVPPAWGLTGTGNYILVGDWTGHVLTAETAQTFWAHDGNQGVSNIPNYEVPIASGGVFDIPTNPPNVYFQVEIKSDVTGLYLPRVDSNNQPDGEKIRPKTGPYDDYWQVFTTAAFGRTNLLQEVVKQITIA